MKKYIVYEDRDILVAYKPAGIATQTARLGQQDMVSELKNYLSGQPQYRGKGEPYLGLVHRLDQPVAGILVFGKTKEAAASLSRQIAEGKLHKYYYAVIYGRPEKEKGTLCDYLYKDGKTNMSRIVAEDFPQAKEARLSYRCVNTLMALEMQEEISLMEIELFTGRHHQIRVQMAHAGMPLLGDSKYGSEEDKEFSRQIGVKNVALCAFRLQFIHPATGKNVKFERMPEEEIFLPFFGNRI